MHKEPLPPPRRSGGMDCRPSRHPKRQADHLLLALPQNRRRLAMGTRDRRAGTDQSSQDHHVRQQPVAGRRKRAKIVLAPINLDAIQGRLVHGRQKAHAQDAQKTSEISCHLPTFDEQAGHPHGRLQQVPGYSVGWQDGYGHRACHAPCDCAHGRQIKSCQCCRLPMVFRPAFDHPMAPPPSPWPTAPGALAN